MKNNERQLKEKYVALDRAIDYLVALSKEFSLTLSQLHIYEALIKSCPTLTVDGNQYIEYTILDAFIKNWKHALKTEDYNALFMERGLEVPKIVDVIEFAESPEFFNQKGHIRPVIKDELWRLFHTDYFIEAVLGGATSIGKNYFSDIAISYMLYQLSCYKSPQIEFDLAPGSSIYFVIQSVSMSLAKRVAFGGIATRIRLSPYFQKHFRFDPKITSELRFPKNITVVPISGTDVSALGMNVYGGLLDEISFRTRTSNSVHTRYTGEEEYDQAQRNYNVIIKRIKGRFQQRGKVPGKLLLVASANYTGDFIDRKKEEAKTDKSIFVMFYTQWDARRDENGELPKNVYSGEMFLVEKGNDVKSPRIIETRDQAIDEDDIIEVPIELKPDFEKDIIQSLKDYGGVGAGVLNPFIPKRELIKKAMDSHVLLNNGSQLFTTDSTYLVDILDINNPDWERIVNQDYLENILNSRSIFAGHLDLAKNKDACGVSIGHIVDYELKPSISIYDPSIDDYREIQDVMVPFYMIDGAMQIKAPPGDEINYELIKRLILYLHLNINLRFMSLDMFQSVMMIQAFRRAGIRSGLQSMITDPLPYTETKNALKDERIYIPNSEIIAREFRELEVDKKGVVDHPANGSNDVTDAIAGTVNLLYTKEAVKNMRPVKSARRFGGVADAPNRKLRIAETSNRRTNLFKIKSI